MASFLRPRCSLHSGVQISVSYMTGLCSDVDINRKTLHLEVCPQMSISIVNAFVTSRGLRFLSYN